MQLQPTEKSLRKNFYDPEEFVYSVGRTAMPAVIESKVTAGLFYHMTHYQKDKTGRRGPAVMWDFNREGNLDAAVDKWFVREGVQNTLVKDKVEEVRFNIPLHYNNRCLITKKIKLLGSLVFMDEESRVYASKVVFDVMSTYFIGSFTFFCRIGMWDQKTKTWRMSDEFSEGLRIIVTDTDGLAKRNAIYLGYGVNDSSTCKPSVALERTWVVAKVPPPLFEQEEEEEEVEDEEEEEEEEERVEPVHAEATNVRTLLPPFVPEHLQVLENDVISFFQPEPEIDLRDDQLLSEISKFVFADDEQETEFLRFAGLLESDTVLELQNNT